MPVSHRIGYLIAAICLAAHAHALFAQPGISDEELEKLSKREAYLEGVKDARVELINDLSDFPSSALLYEWGNYYLDHSELPGAAVYHLMSVTKDPEYAPSLYKLAYIYHQTDRPAMRDHYLNKAVDSGFWGYEVMLEDFEDLSETMPFQELVRRARDHYPDGAKAYIGLYEVAMPEGEAPESGWPILVCLHGWGDDHISYRNVASLAKGVGFAGVCIAGNVPRSPDRFGWSTEDVADTHRYVQSILERAAADRPLDTKRVYLMGFSQGARHAGELAAIYPGSYVGATAYCPGPDVENVTDGHATDNHRPIRVLLGKDDPYLEYGREATEKWSEANPNVTVEQFDGEHHFPPDWQQNLSDTLSDLLVE
tara:strand:+ start:56 stop:1159 length:1104 start_codon:yes stop_codon:yes gene_type:complete